MSPAFAGLAMPIYREVFALFGRLNAGESPSRDEVLGQVRRLIEEADRRAAALPAVRDEYDRARYGLVCWIDEILTDSPWGRDVGWGTVEHMLEWFFYGTRNRSSGFYHAASLAAKSPTTDALETHLLCVAVGFRGEYRSDPDAFSEWVGTTYDRVAEGADLPARPFADDPPGGAVGLAPLGGARLLLTASLVTSLIALGTLAGYIAAVHVALG